MYALFMYFFQGMDVLMVAEYFDKTTRTVFRWIKKYEAGKGIDRIKPKLLKKKFSMCQREWIVQLYSKNCRIHNVILYFIFLFLKTVLFQIY